MHDVEGVLQLAISCLFNVLTGELRLFSLATLNECISNFAYGHVSDPLKPLSNLKFKLGGLLIGLRCKYKFYYDCAISLAIASETWTLAYLLPLLIGDLIPENNKH